MKDSETQAPVGTFFAPAPYVRESANERVWGANGVVVARPAPLSDRSFPDEGDVEHADPDTLQCAVLLSARMSRVHTASFNSGYAVQPCLSDRLRQGVVPLVLRPGENAELFISTLAKDAGLGSTRLRSDQAWVGGKSPLDASLALPDASYLPAQLDDFVGFVRAHQESNSRIAAEAMAFQLLTIHPFADGNGRAARMLLMKLAARSGSLYPLYFAWRLMFDKKRTASNWASLSVSGRPIPSSSHYDNWFKEAVAMSSAKKKAEESGLDSRIATTLLLYGHITPDAIVCANQGCTTSLARKILARSETQEMRVVFNDLEKEVARTIEAWKYAVIK